MKVENFEASVNRYHLACTTLHKKKLCTIFIGLESRNILEISRSQAEGHCTLCFYANGDDGMHSSQ